MTANSNSSLTSMIVVMFLILTTGVRTCESLIQTAVLNSLSRVTLNSKWTLVVNQWCLHPGFSAAPWFTTHWLGCDASSEWWTLTSESMREDVQQDKAPPWTLPSDSVRTTVAFESLQTSCTGMKVAVRKTCTDTLMNLRNPAVILQISLVN